MESTSAAAAAPTCRNITIKALDGVPITPPYLGACGEAAHCGSSVSVPDVANDERWSEQWRDLILSCGLYACLSTPVRGADGRVLASFAMYYDHARDPEPTEPELVEIATHLAAIALEREREAQARSKVQAAHRENEERLSQIIDSAREYAIFTLDGSGCITSWNEGARRLLGYDDNEASGQPGEIFFTPEDRAAGIPAEEMKTALSKGRAANERWHLRKDGSRFWGSGVMLPVERTGRDAFLKIFRDRTHERLEEEHRKLLINELNHRVKNTLATVQSITAQTLRIGGGTGDSCRAGRSPRGAFAGP